MPRVGSDLPSGLGADLPFGLGANLPSAHRADADVPFGHAAGAIEYDPFAPDVMADPYPIYRELRARGRVYRLEQYDAWALPRFDDVWDALADRDRLSIVEGPVFHRDRLLRHNPGPPPDTSAVRPLRSFSMLDPPVHTELRRSIVDPFRPRAVAELEAEVRSLARATLDRLVPRGAFDVRHDYASPVSAAVAARVSGLPVDEALGVVDLVNRYVQRAPGQAGITEDGAAARDELDARLLDYVAARRSRGPSEQPDVVDALLAFTQAGSVPERQAGSVPERQAGGTLSDREIVDQVVTLFVGGTETLPKVMAGGALELCRRPDQRRAITLDPSLAVPAFEEMLRTELPLQFVGRTLRVDVEIAGVPMRAGQRLVLLLISANRDEREFDEPDRFDATRVMSRHLGLGHGAHVCIGAHVARLEGVVMLQELLARCPEYGIDDTELVREASEFQVGWAAMPILCV